MSKFKYKKRIVDTMLKRRLMTMGAVLIEGPKLCGKSTTALQQAASVLNMEPGRTLELARLDPKLILQGEVPRLIDEWQLAPNLWDAIRREVDARNGEKGQFMLTGSAVPVDVSLLKHSGTGRFAWLKMRPMTLVESGESSGAVSLNTLSIMSRQSSMLIYHEPTTLSVMKKQHVACYEPMPGIRERRFQRLNWQKTLKEAYRTKRSSVI